MIVAVMGVAGSGKTTVGTMLADALHCPFVDGDSLHSDANIQAMENGRPLTDADRAPWLATIRARLLDAMHRGDSLVVACSALKQSYRDVLGRDIPIVWVFLKGEANLIRDRLDRRTGHFMKSDLLASQLAELEEPSEAIVMHVAGSPDAIVTGILAALCEKPDVRILPDLHTLSLRAAQAAVGIINDTVRRTGRCSLVLSGGSTPIQTHRLLASTFSDQIPWPLVHVFWGDERYVPHDAAQSNYRMAKDTLLDHVPCPAVNIHPMPTHFGDPAAAAREYEATLTRYWAGEEPRLDLVLLGMGPDGHTASLFPGAPALHERNRWVVAATVPAEPSIRLTLTVPAFARSIEAHFLVAGHDKAHALEQVLSGFADSTVYPAAGIRPLQGKVIWWVDRHATRKEE
jgi:6-phosphogluconolactonase